MMLTWLIPSCSRDSNHTGQTGSPSPHCKNTGSIYIHHIVVDIIIPRAWTSIIIVAHHPDVFLQDKGNRQLYLIDMAVAWDSLSLKKSRECRRGSLLYCSIMNRNQWPHPTNGLELDRELTPPPHSSPRTALFESTL